MDHPGKAGAPSAPIKLSVVIPCYNEAGTLVRTVDKVLAIARESLALELIIVDDGSTDGSLELARQIQRQHPSIKVLHHSRNLGKGAALHTGFASATGDIVCINDADDEYNPNDLTRLITPIIEGKADVVFGSRYRKDEPRPVLHFWHSTMNRFLTFVSNMFTNMDLTDMETCYKVFRADVVRSMTLKERGFGVEPEITAKLAHLGCRVYEMGVSYSPRSYEEGKKITWQDGVHALYCTFHYGASIAPSPIQLMIYVFIGGVAALCNIGLFMGLMQLPMSVAVASAIAYVVAAAVNYWLCISLLFRHKARWNTIGEIIAYTAIVAASGMVDVAVTTGMVQAGTNNFWAKASASLLVLMLNFLGRKYFVFKERPGSLPQPTNTVDKTL